MTIFRLAYYLNFVNFAVFIISPKVSRNQINKFKSSKLFQTLGDIMVVEYGEFKGNKMLILKRNADDTYPFQFGKNKAKLIVENYAEIKKFAEEE